MDIFIILLGGIIICGLIYLLISYIAGGFNKIDGFLQKISDFLDKHK